VVSIVEYRSQPVSVLGAVTNPGVVQLKGKKTLTEVIALAGGLRPDAGGEIRITRNFVGEPREASAPDSSAPAPMVSQINVADVVNGSAKAASILILPHDTVTVPRAELVYVAGDVRKPGGFPLPASGGITVLQSVALAEGLGTEAAGKHAKIFRSPGNGEQKEEIPVDLSAILAGKAEDFQLKPRDILFVPNSASKHAGVRAAEAAIQAATGLAIWRR
jgi:polysaccharide export outer membrane protein